MRMLRSALLALVVAIVPCALGAAPALADDGGDRRGRSPARRRSSRANVTIDVGDTVRWEFDQAATTHTVTSSSAELDDRRDRARPTARRSRKTFDTPGVYTFLCKVHSGMTGSVTVAGRRRPRSRRCSSSRKTAGFRHDSIPQGIAAIQALGAANGFTVDATEDATAVHRRQPRAVRRRRLPLHDRRRPQRRAADRVRALHRGRRRLRRHPRRVRHRVHVALVRPDARRLLPQPPGRNADRDGQHRGRRRALHDRASGPLDARRRVVQLPAADQPRGRRQRRHPDYSPARQRRPRPRRRSTSRPTTRTTATPTDDDHPVAWCIELRRRPRLVHGARPHAGVLLRAGLPPAPARRPEDRRRRRHRRLRRAAPGRRRPRNDFEIAHARRRHREPDGARRRQGRPRASTSSASPARSTSSRPNGTRR